MTAPTRAALHSRRRALALLAGAALTPSTAHAARRWDRFDVIVIGAGIAGLYATYLLEKRGLKVCLLEASHRVGGRILTLDDLPCAPNASAVQIGGSYRRMRDMATTLGVAIEPDASETRTQALFVGGRLRTAADWPRDTANPFPESLKNATPASALFRIAGASNPLSGPLDWRDPRFAPHDVSAADFLASRGFNAAARELIDVGLNANRLATYSMLNVYRSLALFRTDASLGPTGSVRGGTERFIEALAAACNTEVRTDMPVRALDSSSNGVTARLVNGRSIHGSFALCTMPFPALQRVRLSAPLPPAQRAAITGLPYTQIVQLYLEPATKFWESDGAPPDMWTDTALERIFAVHDRETRAPNGLLVAWVNGAQADWTKGLSDAAIEAKAREVFAQIRPASEGRVKLLKMVRWTDENPLAGGAYMHWAPGQIARWADVMGAPAGRLHFAGEHLSRAHTGLEGAMESAEIAANAILAEAGA